MLFCFLSLLHHPADRLVISAQPDLVDLIHLSGQLQDIAFLARAQIHSGDRFPETRDKILHEVLDLREELPVRLLDMPHGLFVAQHLVAAVRNDLADRVLKAQTVFTKHMSVQPLHQSVHALRVQLFPHDVLLQPVVSLHAVLLQPVRHFMAERYQHVMPAPSPVLPVDHAEVLALDVYADALAALRSIELLVIHALEVHPDPGPLRNPRDGVDLAPDILVQFVRHLFPGVRPVFRAVDRDFVILPASGFLHLRQPVLPVLFHALRDDLIHHFLAQNRLRHILPHFFPRHAGIGKQSRRVRLLQC